MKKANQEIKSFRLDFYVQSMIFFGVETNVFHPLKKKNIHKEIARKRRTFCSVCRRRGWSFLAGGEHLIFHTTTHINEIDKEIQKRVIGNCYNLDRKDGVKLNSLEIIF